MTQKVQKDRKMPSKDNNVYRSTIRSASKKVELLKRSFGIAKETPVLRRGQGI